MSTAEWQEGDRVAFGFGEDRDTGTVLSDEHPYRRDLVRVWWDSGEPAWCNAEELELETEEDRDQ